MIRLFELRTEKNLSQRDIAKIFNISQGTYNNWENGKTEPSIEQLIALSKFFDVSVDYLINNSDDTGFINYDNILSENDKNFLDTFNKLPLNIKNDLYQLIQTIKKQNSN